MRRQVLIEKKILRWKTKAEYDDLTILHAGIFFHTIEHVTLKGAAMRQYWL
jgi:hypothetical protein